MRYFTLIISFTLLLSSCGNYAMQYAEKDSEVNLTMLTDTCFSYDISVDDDSYPDSIEVEVLVNPDSNIYTLRYMRVQFTVCDSTGDSVGFLLPTTRYVNFWEGASWYQSGSADDVDLRQAPDSLQFDTLVKAQYGQMGYVTFMYPLPDSIQPPFLDITLTAVTEMEGKEISFTQTIHLERKMVRVYSGGGMGKIFCQNHSLPEANTDSAVVESEQYLHLTGKYCYNGIHQHKHSSTRHCRASLL